MGLASLKGASVLADRKGGTSLEYAMVASMLAGAIMACFHAYFTRVDALIAGLNWL